MNDQFTIDIFENSLNHYPIFEGFELFSNDLKELNNLIEHFEEAVSNVNSTVKNQAASIAKRTIDTTTDIGKVYGNVTDSGGNILSSIWAMITSAISIITKIISFILNKLAFIPRAIASLLGFIEDLPENITNKIKGNIKINITPDAIELYFKKILKDLDDFIDNGKLILKTDDWKNLSHYIFSSMKSGISVNTLENLWNSKSDIGRLKLMSAIAKRLNGFKITPTIVEIKNSDVAKIYFSNETVINVMDYKGKEYRLSYWNSLLHILKGLEDRKNDFKLFSETFSNKIINSRENSTKFLSLSKKNQDIIYNTIVNTSTIINVIGKFMEAIIIDLNTIKKNYDKISKTNNK